MNDVVKKETGNIVTFDASMFLEDADTATENMTSDSFQIPRLYLLQNASDAIKKSSDKYVTDAEAGNILESATQTVHDGKKGITFVPAYYERTWIEWSADGKSFVKDHGSDLAAIGDGQYVGNTYKFLTTEGTEVRETANYYGLLVDGESVDPVVLPMSKTNLTSSKQFNMMMARLRIPHPKKQGETFNPASFWNAYLLTTGEKQFASGPAFVYKAMPLFNAESGGVVNNLPNGEQIYLQAKKLRDDIKKGDAKANDADMI